MEFFLTVFPFVYINKHENDILFYNTVSGDSLSFKNNIFIAELVNKLEQQEYACTVDEDEIIKLNQLDFFNLLVEKNLGYYIDKSYFHLNPVTTQCTEINNQNFVAQFRNNEYIIENLQEVTFYVNNNTGSTNNNQFLFPIYETQCSELHLSKIEQVISEIDINKVRINILGGNIFKYSQIESLIKFFNKTTYNVFYYFHYSDCIETLSQELLSLINENDTKLILVDFPFNETLFKLWNTETKNTIIEFIVSSEEEIEESEKIIDKYKIEKYIFRPFYNGHNIDFFKENVFVNEKDILSVKESLFTLATKKISNPSFFGKLAIDAHENVYSNINLPPVSTVSTLNLKQLVYKLITEEDSIWLKNKTCVKPCSNCIYNLLCPPISNYELVLNRNNLCNVVL